MKGLSCCSAVVALLGLGRAASASNSTAAALLSSGNVQLGDYEDAYTKAKAFVAQLTNEQKLSVITGGDVAGTNVSWTALASKDGSAGVNFQYFVSGFTMGNALAMTWDRDAFLNQSFATGREFYLMGYNLINSAEVGPLGRTPYGGRQPEAYSPDPYLSGIAAAQVIEGMNQAGVIATGRHFILNEQETNRKAGFGSSAAPYSSNADDKTMHELYLWPFADAVRAGMGAVMSAMSKVNNTLSSENGPVLNGLLKEQLGFPGLVVADYGSQASAFESANAGLDFGSESYWSNLTLLAGIANGSFTQERLDDMVVRNVIGYYFVGLDDGKQPAVAELTEYRAVRADHAKLIRKISGESLALLKNERSGGRGLPLESPLTISIFGTHAGPSLAGPNRPFSFTGTPGDVYQGHLAASVGSGSLSFSYLATPYDALSLRAAADGSMLRWIMNDTYPDSSSGGGGGGGGGGWSSSDGTADTPSITTYAKNSEVCIVFLNADSGEGADRAELANADQDALVTSVADDCSNTIVVINSSGPRLVEQWAEHDNVTAIVYGGLLGQESGNAIVDVLYGDVNPSGKLIHTIAKNESDYPVAICETAQCDFTEGVHIDYRYFDAQNMSVRYAFGHGLSYTNFTYGEASAEQTDAQALASTYPTGPLTLGGSKDLFDGVISVSTTLTNTGGRDGAEVAQLYISYPESAQQPVRQLRGFEKVQLSKGETKDVTFSVRRRDVSYWDVAAQKWAVAKGTYGFAIGSSSRDIRVETSIEV